MDGAIPANVQSKKMVFTRAFEGTSGYRGQSAKTLLSIANPNNDPITVKLTLYQITASNAAQTSLEQTRTIAGNGCLIQSVVEIFGEPLASNYAAALSLQTRPFTEPVE